MPALATSDPHAALRLLHDAGWVVVDPKCSELFRGDKALVFTPFVASDQAVCTCAENSILSRDESCTLNHKTGLNLMFHSCLWLKFLSSTHAPCLEPFI